MHRPDHPSADNGRFTDGDPGQGIDGTLLQASWLNDGCLEELVNLVEGSGLSLSKPDNDQVLQAVNTLIAQKSPLRANLLANPSFDIWQGINQPPFTPTGTTWQWAHADCWYVNPNGASTQLTVSRESFSSGQTEVDGFPTYYMRVAKNAVQPNNNPKVATFLEDVRNFAEGFYTVSFWAKADASMTVNVVLVQDYGQGSADSDVDLGFKAVTVTTSWQRFTFTQQMQTVSNKDVNDQSHLRLEFRPPSVATSWTFELAQVQVERGTVATAFRPLEPGEALRRCQRFFATSWDAVALGDAPGVNNKAGALVGEHAPGTEVFHLRDRFFVPMRTAPTMRWYSVATGTKDKVHDVDDAADRTVVGTVGTSKYSTGWPQLDVTQTGEMQAHWRADALLTI